MGHCYLTQCYELSGVHQLDHLDPSSKKDGLHGHHYKVEITLTGPLEKRGQWVASRDLVDRVVKKHILEAFDKTLLNKHFAKTSGEYLSKSFYEILKDSEIGNLVVAVSLQETKKNRFSYSESDHIE